MREFLLILQLVLGIIVIVTVLLQPSKSDALSGLIQGSRTETFYSKNKVRTKEAMLARFTVISVALFALNTIALNLI